jgi:phenylpropionate dioxygenase-like ring-hydroxylating dioxygenase large terminal subunit
MPDASRETRLQRYLHARVRRHALAMDLRLLERTQQGLGSLEPGDMGVIADNEPALCWFTRRAQQAFGGAGQGAKRAAPRRTLRRRTVVPASSP